jgi:peptidyl-prolyl cis-trans isomerase B (cyclophilin B)
MANDGIMRRMTAALLASSLAFTVADLTPTTPFARPDGAMTVRLTGVTAPCELVVLDADAKELARAKTDGGEVDLAKLFPSIRSVTRAVRVQTLVDGAPAGAPLLVVPLVSRATIRTTSAKRPDGVASYTRIIGWGDEVLEPTNEEYAKLKAAWPKTDPSPLSGFRLERDRDVIFETTAGTIRFAMRPDEAPNTARNFVELAASGFYDGTIIHRVVSKGRGGTPFVIQGGDPIGTGDGGPGYDIALEPSMLAHDFGVLSMARNDWPDSAGSQWFVGLTRAETARLDGQYCAFGEAIEGTEAIIATEQGAIADTETGRPVSPVSVNRATVIPAAAWVPGAGRSAKRVARPEAVK